jgi:hypothetical protein
MLKSLIWKPWKGFQPFQGRSAAGFARDSDSSPYIPSQLRVGERLQVVDLELVVERAKADS